MKPSADGVRHPRAFVLGEWAAAADVRPYAAPKQQQSETQSEYLRHSKLRIGLTRLTKPAYSTQRVFLLLLRGVASC